MPRTIELTFPHNLGAAEACRRVSDRLAALKSQFGDKLGASKITWAGNDANVWVRALGQAATGTVNVTDDNVRIIVRLPMLLTPLSGKIGGYLSGVADQALRP